MSVRAPLIDPVFLGSYEQFLRNPGGIRDPEDSQGEFLALTGDLVRPATWHGLPSERPVRPPDIARVCAIMTIERDGEGLGSDGFALGRCLAQDAVRVGRGEVLGDCPPPVFQHRPYSWPRIDS